VWDLRVFLVFYVMIIVSFCSTQIILNMYYINLDEQVGPDYAYSPLFSDVSGSMWLDAFSQTWSLGLGSFRLLDYAGKQSYLPWLIYYIATFVTNIMFLNMLIAVMGDTWERMKDKREQIGLMQRTQLISDFIQNFTVQKTLDTSRYLYLVTPQKLNSKMDSDE
jgi:hypothetical protein